MTETSVFLLLGIVTPCVVILAWFVLGAVAGRRAAKRRQAEAAEVLRRVEHLAATKGLGGEMTVAFNPTLPRHSPAQPSTRRRPAPRPAGVTRHRKP